MPLVKPIVLARVCASRGWIWGSDERRVTNDHSRPVPRLFDERGLARADGTDQRLLARFANARLRLRAAFERLTVKART
jgi:hypothetical protein